MCNRKSANGQSQGIAPTAALPNSDASHFYDCPLRKRPVDMAVCIVRQERFPRECHDAKCEHVGGAE